MNDPRRKPAEQPLPGTRSVFVIGSPRSGTSVLAWTLAQHPDMCTGPEADFFEKLKETRNKNVPRGELRPGDARKFYPYRGQVRAEDTMAQGYYGRLITGFQVHF